MDKTSIKAVAFDLGGVLVYDIWETALLDQNNGLVKKYNLDNCSVENVGKELWNEFAYRTLGNFEILEYEYWDKFRTRMNIDATVSSLIQHCDSFIQPLPGMQEVLQKLSRTSVKLAICSNTTEFWFQRIWNKLQLDRVFRESAVTLSCRVGKSKVSPNFEMFNNLIRSSDIPQNEWLFIDDSRMNIEKALLFGMPCLLFPASATFGARYLNEILPRMNIFSKG